MTDFLKELEWRGFVQDATPRLDAHLAKGPVTLYCGFDLTAPSLQLGNLLPLMLLRQFQRHGHKPIVLMGGGTSLIGDPSGKRTERPLLSKEQIKEHLQRQRDQMARFLDFGPGPAAALLLDNAKWLVEQRLTDFLRDVGKHFTVNVMLQKESVQGRMEAGISYTEFSYMLLQAFDFLHLFRTQHCTLQVGGSDQWGNITAGADLIRKVESGEAHGLVAPLVTSASGKKFGKTEEGAVWLNPALTSPYQFYQFWMNVDDRDVEKYLKLFTERSRDDLKHLAAQHEKDPGARVAQRALATDVTTLVHGADLTRQASEAAAILFGEFDPGAATAGVFDILAAEIPTTQADGAGSPSLVDALTLAGLAKSKSEARRAIEQGGVYVNQQREKNVDRKIDAGDWLAGGNLLLRKGKKEYALLRRG
ncbi:MAG TPA: tyrosine--tRNA ligase [Gemmatimonadales bacterium]